MIVTITITTIIINSNKGHIKSMKDVYFPVREQSINSSLNNRSTLNEENIVQKLIKYILHL